LETGCGVNLSGRFTPPVKRILSAGETEEKIKGLHGGSYLQATSVPEPWATSAAGRAG
jgi:hypothetical protein